MDQKTVDNICRISMEFGELVGKKKMNLPDEYAATDYLVDNILEWLQEFEKTFNPEGEYLSKIAVFAHQKFRKAGWLPDQRTKIVYLYRDACNYKVLNCCVINGELLSEQMMKIRECCQESEYFIPSEVGLTEERFSSYTEDDHPFFELLGFEPTDEPVNIAITPEELVRKFDCCRGKWDELATKHYVY